MAKKYKKKPVVIEALQFTLDTWSEMCDFANVGPGKNQAGAEIEGEGHVTLKIPTLEGVMTAEEGDWIIRGIKGELYPCKPDIFEATYDPAEEE